MSLLSWLCLADPSESGLPVDTSKISKCPIHTQLLANWEALADVLNAELEEFAF